MKKKKGKYTIFLEKIMYIEHNCCCDNCGEYALVSTHYEKPEFLCAVCGKDFNFDLSKIFPKTSEKGCKKSIN